MNKEEIYKIWRPKESLWSPWVKPVLFSFMDSQIASAEHPAPKFQASLMPNTAVIADLPGAEGVLYGVELSQKGYRPIPIYNACPAVFPQPGTSLLDAGYSKRLPSEVDVLSIMSSLSNTANDLQGAHLPATAPPAFLLDSNRRGKGGFPQVGSFDNRSFITVADFPSEDFLKLHGISQVVLVQNDTKVRPDLLLVLLAWQNTGITILQQNLAEEWKPRTIEVKRLSLFEKIWEFLVRSNYHRPMIGTGSFGGMVHGGGG